MKKLLKIVFISITSIIVLFALLVFFEMLIRPFIENKIGRNSVGPVLIIFTILIFIFFVNATTKKNKDILTVKWNKTRPVVMDGRLLEINDGNFWLQKSNGEKTCLKMSNADISTVAQCGGLVRAVLIKGEVWAFRNHQTGENVITRVALRGLLLGVARSGGIGTFAVAVISLIPIVGLFTVWLVGLVYLKFSFETIRPARNAFFVLLYAICYLSGTFILLSHGLGGTSVFWGVAFNLSIIWLIERIFSNDTDAVEHGLLERLTENIDIQQLTKDGAVPA
ncbi:MAG: hypothetical protein WBF84_17075 [Castellaniella sp.]|uniref:hypothetical protein n=1 Tax=Castellaniella sp. TaxID=1955812 RepID=UPI003C7154E6